MFEPKKWVNHAREGLIYGIYIAIAWHSLSNGQLAQPQEDRTFSFTSSHSTIRRTYIRYLNSIDVSLPFQENGYSNGYSNGCKNGYANGGLKNGGVTNGHATNFYRSSHEPQSHDQKESFEPIPMRVACFTLLGFYLLMFVGFLNQLFFAPKVATEKNRDVSLQIVLWLVEIIGDSTNDYDHD